LAKYPVGTKIRVKMSDDYWPAPPDEYRGRIGIVQAVLTRAIRNGQKQIDYLVEFALGDSKAIAEPWLEAVERRTTT